MQHRRDAGAAAQPWRGRRQRSAIALTCEDRGDRCEHGEHGQRASPALEPSASSSSPVPRWPSTPSRAVATCTACPATVRITRSLRSAARRAVVRQQSRGRDGHDQRDHVVGDHRAGQACGFAPVPEARRRSSDEEIRACIRVCTVAMSSVHRLGLMPSEPEQRETLSAAETERLGADLATHLAPGDVVLDQWRARHREDDFRARGRTGRSPCHRTGHEPDVHDRAALHNPAADPVAFVSRWTSPQARVAAGRRPRPAGRLSPARTRSP